MLKEIMQYFQAVQEGKKRANEAQMKLFDIAGFAMLTLTTKKKDGKFIPIGAENYCAAIHRPEGYLVILVDAEGYTKAQTKDLEKEEAGQIYSKVAESGIEEFSGNQITIWTETCLLYTSPSPRDQRGSRMPSSA